MSWVAVVVGVGGAVASAALAPDAPDNSGMNRAAESQAALSKEQLDWSKQIYAETAPERAEATRIALEQGRLQTEAAKKQLAAADDTLAYQKETFRPAEQKLVADALAYDTPERREAAARAAMADVEIQQAAQREATMRSMEARGVAPNSGRVAAMSGMMDLGAARLKVGAANTARQQVETMGVARLGDVANLGRGIASNQVAQVQSGVNAGNSAAANGQVPVNVAASGAGIMQQGFAGAQSAMGSSGSLYGAVANMENQANANQASMYSGLGSAAGMWAAGKWR